MENNNYVDYPQSYLKHKNIIEIEPKLNLFSIQDIKNKILKAVILQLNIQENREIEYKSAVDVLINNPVIKGYEFRKEAIIKEYNISLKDNEEIFINENVVSLVEAGCEEYTIGLHDEILIRNNRIDGFLVKQIINQRYDDENIIFNYRDAIHDRGVEYASYLDIEELNHDLRDINYKDYTRIADTLLFHLVVNRVKLGDLLDFQGLISDISIIEQNEELFDIEVNKSLWEIFKSEDYNQKRNNILDVNLSKRTKEIFKQYEDGNLIDAKTRRFLLNSLKLKKLIINSRAV